MPSAHPAPTLDVPALTDVLHTLRLPTLSQDLHALHRMVAAATDGAARPLWALPQPGLLVVRSSHLRLNAVPEQAAVATTTVPVPVPADGTAVVWSLIANPSRAVPPRGTDTGRSKRVALPADRVPAWASGKLTGPLAEVRVDRITRMPPLGGFHPRTGAALTIERWAIAGSATVASRAGLAALMAAGVGPAKAFGCGLLLVGEAG